MRGKNYADHSRICATYIFTLPMNFVIRVLVPIPTLHSPALKQFTAGFLCRCAFAHTNMADNPSEKKSNLRRFPAELTESRTPFCRSFAERRSKPGPSRCHWD